NNCFQVSLYSMQSIKEMQETANFKFDILKYSFTKDYHNAKADITMDIALKYIKYFDQTNENKYLDITKDLIQRYLHEHPGDSLSIINMYQILIRTNSSLSKEQERKIANILDEARKNQKWDVCFACEILLKSGTRAQMFFEKLNQ